MFLEHFQLRANPFEVTADARFLYFGAEHRDALSALYLSILEGRGLAALIASPGMGKTTLLRYLAARLKDRASVVLFSHPHSTREDLMSDLARRLRLPSGITEYQLMTGIQMYLRRLAAERRKLVLLFDEAQALSLEALEQVRLLSNLRSSNMSLLEIIVAGQGELEDILKKPSMEAFRQRISVTARLRPLDAMEVGRYLERRLKVAGRAEPLFDQAAVEAIARESGGTPRNINQLCYKALALAWADGDDMVGQPLILEAARELDWPGVPSDTRTDEQPPAEVKVAEASSPLPQRPTPAQIHNLRVV